MEQNRKKNILLALAFSLLTALGGSVIFGIIYGIGFYIYLLAAAEIYVACIVYFKHIEKTTWWHILISVVWSLFWTVVFNVLAVCVCESIVISNTFDLSFFESFEFLITLWQTDADINIYMSQRVGEIVGMIFLGGIIYITSLIVKKVSNKKRGNTQQTQNTTQIAETTKPEIEQIKSEQTVEHTEYNAILDSLYPAIFKDVETAIEEYSLTKNQEILKTSLKEILTKYNLKNLEESEKTELLELINSQLANDKLTNLERKVNTTILKLIK